MHMRMSVGFIFMLGLGAAATVRPHLQDPKPVPRAPSGDILRRAQELSRTTVEHERLLNLSGKWNVILRTSIADADNASGGVREDKGTVVGQSMLGGRFLALNFRAKVQGRAVEGLQILGFDTLRRAYTSSWRDNATTWSLDCLGGLGRDPGLLKLTGLLRDASTPEGRSMSMTIDMRTKDQVTIRIYEERGLDEVLMQEQVWQR